MILGIGTDIVAVKRFRDTKIELLNRILSPEDMNYINRFKDPVERIAGIWAAKEALVKALDKKELEFNRVSVFHTESGKPYFSYLPENGELHLSITHEKEYACAFVLWAK